MVRSVVVADSVAIDRYLDLLASSLIGTLDPDADLVLGAGTLPDGVPAKYRVAHAAGRAAHRAVTVVGHPFTEDRDILFRALTTSSVIGPTLSCARVMTGAAGAVVSTS